VFQILIGKKKKSLDISNTIHSTATKAQVLIRRKAEHIEGQ